MAELCGAPTLSGNPCQRAAGSTGRCSLHPPDDIGRVRREVDRALAGRPVDWRTELARTLAASLDVEPQASMARELRALMGAMDANEPAKEVGDVDDLAARRAARRAAAGGPQ